MPELYFHPMACSLASRIALREAGIVAQYRPVDVVRRTAAGDSADFPKISAKGQVPVLVLDDGSVLTEGAAVLQRIADMNPQAGLAPPPNDPARYRLQEWLNFIATELHKAVLAPIFSRDTPEAVKDFARSRARKVFPIAAERLETSAHLMGERFSVADAYLIWVLLLARVGGIDLSDWPSLTAYFDRMLQRPNVRDAIAEERHLAQAAS
jgi:glutathione S-transferase